jgi:hypothetical protein
MVVPFLDVLSWWQRKNVVMSASSARLGSNFRSERSRRRSRDLRRVYDRGPRIWTVVPTRMSFPFVQVETLGVMRETFFGGLLGPSARGSRGHPGGLRICALAAPSG